MPHVHLTIEGIFIAHLHQRLILQIPLGKRRPCQMHRGLWITRLLHRRAREGVQCSPFGKFQGDNVHLNGKVVLCDEAETGPRAVRWTWVLTPLRSDRDPAGDVLQGCLLLSPWLSVRPLDPYFLLSCIFFYLGPLRVPLWNGIAESLCWLGWIIFIQHLA